MSIDIDRLSEAELVDLNNRIVERLRFLQQTKMHRQMLEFSIGDRVAFDPPNGEAKCGTLIRYNKKTVTVLTDIGERWNVAPVFLRRAELVIAAETTGTRKGEVVALHRKPTQ